MKRIGVNLFLIPRFYEVAQIHNADTVTNMFHYAQVMGDKNIGKI